MTGVHRRSRRLSDEAETTVIVWLLRTLVAVFVLSPVVLAGMAGWLRPPAHVVPPNAPIGLYICGDARC